MSRRSILVIGSANIDLVARASRCPRPGESLIAHGFATVPGGKGANQAVAAARLGARVTFAGCVGDDVFAGELRRSLSAEGIDITRLKAAPGVPTGTALITVGDDGQNAITVFPGANFELRPADVMALETQIREADVMMLQLEIPLDTIEIALSLARRCGTLTVLDAGPAQAVPDSLLRLSDVLSPNETEAHALTGRNVALPGEREAAAQALLATGARDVVFKLGGEGSHHFARSSAHYAAPYRIEPLDTTAAGDAFTAALALRWGTAPVNEVLCFANGAGALAATRHGAQPSMPTLQEVEDFITAPR